MLTWQDVQQGIFAGESGGDYNALFGFQNKPDGLFSDIKVTDMTLDQVLKFADPRGEYASYVSYNNDGEISTPMGAYQIVGSTLRDAKEALGLSGDTKFTKETQDKIAKWILKTQGTDAWVGYKGTRVPPQAKQGTKTMASPTPFNPNNAVQTAQMMQQMPTQGGLMGYLRDPRVRQALTSMSRTKFGARLNALAKQDLALGLQKQKNNATAQYLMKQPNGAPYANAILSGAMTGEQAYAQYLKDKADGTLSTKDQNALVATTKKDFVALSRVKDFDQIAQAYGRINASAAEPSAAGDIALIFNYMKMLDPNSVVRESEFATAAKAGSFGEVVKAAIQNIEKGTLLTPIQRQDFVARAKRLYKAQEEGYDQIRNKYTQDAVSMGLPEDILPDFRYEGKELDISPTITMIPLNPDPDKYTEEEWITKWQMESEEWRQKWLDSE